tara:strand:+ start:284 stop:637 length:354 start_codon:yes stop_codon:yes gene_type:complete
MQHFLSTAGIAGFLLVMGLNVVFENDLGTGLVHALIAALAFTVLTRWFMRKTYTALHASLYESQVAAARKAQEEAEAKAAEEAEAAKAAEAAEDQGALEPETMGVEEPVAEPEPIPA